MLKLKKNRETTIRSKRRAKKCFKRTTNNSKKGLKTTIKKTRTKRPKKTLEEKKV